VTKTVIFHNPRCTKSRQTLQLLRDQGVEPRIVEYLNEPPSAAKLDAILKMLGKEPLELIRTKEARFKELGLSTRDERPRREWIRLMVENPVLIERPVVVRGAKAAVGRPPEDVLKIL